MKTPLPETVRALSTSLQLTQKEAADLVQVSTRAWQLWAEEDQRAAVSLGHAYKLKMSGIILTMDLTVVTSTPFDPCIDYAIRVQPIGIS